ncbi:MAG: TIGR03790 family protein [Rubrivivax sp.]|nr:TIGR03790 family protein [Rubrivivax sp.]
MSRLAILLGLVTLLTACGGGGGGGGGSSNPAAVTLGPQQLAVLYAEGDPLSESIARAYQAARGVPAANVVGVPVDVSGDQISPEAFATLKAAVDARVPSGTQALLVTWGRPSRVAGACAMGLTSALAFGYDTRWCANGCGVTAASPYYDSDSHRPFTDHAMRPAMMLGAASLAEAQTLIARGVAADASLASGSTAAHAWLVRTTDAARSVRYLDFEALARTSVAGITLHYQDNAAGTGSNVVANQSGVLVYFTGLEVVPQIATNTWLPGAAADHLTSYGGRLPDGLGQMPATEWLKAGATATYGTVDEPCALTDKFPRASVLVKRYRAGDTLLEAYWKSVRWPGQGLFLGEPLARPYSP